MYVFVSHKREDLNIARLVASQLAKNGARFYVDEYDPSLAATGDDISEHLREAIGECDHLIAVTSEITRLSWWVPWEIGIALEKDYPLATYAGDNAQLPEYLDKWPILRTVQDIDHYVRMSEFSQRQASLLSGVTNEQRQRRFVREFHEQLKRKLGQT